MLLNPSDKSLCDEVGACDLRTGLSFLPRARDRKAGVLLEGITVSSLRHWGAHWGGTLP